MSVRSTLISVMERAARRAAPQLRRDFGEVENLQVSNKGPADFVSQADLRAEATLREDLSKARPEWGFLLEEGGVIEGQADMPRWIVDPLDGTTNFLHGIPHFSISIAVEEAGELTSALIYNPITDESFWAAKGKGAWLGERRLRVSARRDLGSAIFATGIPYKGHGRHDDFHRVLATITPHVAGIRRFGAAALDLAWLAAGRYDGYWEDSIKPWDMAAGILMVREAGGLITDYDGGTDMMGRGSVIAANANLHNSLAKLIVQGRQG